MIVLLSLALITARLTTPALAQDEPPPLLAAPLSYAEGWVWRDVTPQSAGRFAAVDAGEDWAVAVDIDGGVWRSRAGDTWYSVLEAPESEDAPDKEALLLEAESLMEDFFDGSEIINESSGDDQTGLEEVDPLGVEGLIRSERSASVATGPAIWVDDSLVLLSRTDGLWRSDDAGRSFDKTSHSGDFLSFVHGPGALVIGGTADGALYSLDGGRSWIDSDDALDGRAITALSGGADGIWYAVADGAVYTSGDAADWSLLPLEGSLGGARAVLVDPTISDALWIASDERLFRLDQGRLDTLGNHPLGELSRLRLGGAPGHLLWAGGDGVWESRDGGVSWRAASAGLSQPQVNDLVVAPAGPVAATEDGLFLLVRPVGVENRGSIDTSRQVEVSFALLLDRAMTRPGMDPSLYNIGPRSTVIRQLLPDLIVRGQLSSDRQLDAYYTGTLGDHYTGYNTSSELGRGYLQVELRWGGSSYSDGETSFDVADVTDQLFVLGDTVYVDSPDSDFTASAAANVTAEASTYRTRVGSELARLQADREQLLYDREALRGAELADRVDRELSLLEVNARIDAYTDGALDALLRGSP